MVRVTVMYEQKQDIRFDEDYFLNKHIPMVREKLEPMGMLKLEIDRGISGGGGNPAPYLFLAHMAFESLESFQKAFGQVRDEISSDVPIYTDIKPEIQISEIVY